MKISDFEGITEKLWAYLTIKQLLDKAEIAEDENSKNELKMKAKQLALQVSETKTLKRERNWIIALISRLDKIVLSFCCIENVISPDISLRMRFMPSLYSGKNNDMHVITYIRKRWRTWNVWIKLEKKVIEGLPAKVW